MSALAKGRRRARAKTPLLRGEIGNKARSRLNTRQHIWQVICDLTRANEWFTLSEAVNSTASCATSTVRNYLQALRAAGYVERRDASAQGGSVLWRVVKFSKTAPRLRRDGTPSRDWRGQQQLWNAMRKLKSFDWHELAAVASTPECPVAPGTAQRYVGLLHRAGYLQKVQPARAGRRARWKLRLDTGPRAPRVVRAVHDPNTGHIHFGPDSFEE